jgi:hypothetical protein
MEKAPTAMYGVISIRFDLNFLKFVYYVVCNLYCLPTPVFLLYTNHVDKCLYFLECFKIMYVGKKNSVDTQVCGTHLSVYYCNLHFIFLVTQSRTSICRFEITLIFH